MKTANKTGCLIADFLTSAVLSCTAVISINYYIPFVKQTAGTYNIVMIFGGPLRDFLIKILLLLAGILVFVTFFVKSKTALKEKRIYPFYMIGMGILWIILPFLSAYTISRFTGDLILQTVSGIAIIANVVFMMISVCCGMIAVTDIIHNLLLCENKSKADTAVSLLSGIPTGCALTFLLTSVLQPRIGLNGIFIVFGAAVVLIGLLSASLKKRINTFS